MSYYTCVNQLTDCQLDIVAMQNDYYRKLQYNATEINWKDYVEFEGTSKKMNHVSVYLEFPEVITDLNYVRDYTTNTGTIQAELLDDKVTANIIRIT